MVKIVGDGKEEIIVPIVFPDKSIQIRLKEQHFSPTKNQIIWEYENDGEIMLVQQAVDYVKYLHPFCFLELEIPYLPYARQDKDISNTSTWALHSFAKMINAMKLDGVSAYDVHNKEITNILIERFTNKDPKHFLSHLNNLSPNAILFPDAGAKSRYYRYLGPFFRNHHCNYWIGQKNRDPLTGTITNYEIDLNGSNDILRKDVVIIDDLCDAGGTFILAAEKLREYNPKSLSLMVTHGLYTKGLTCLFDAGYDMVIDINNVYKKISGGYVKL